MRLPFVLRQFIKFCAVGTTGTGVQYLAFYAMIGPGRISDVFSLGFSHWLGMNNNYYWNQKWTFGGVGVSMRDLLTYYCAGAAGLVTQYATYFPLIWFFSLPSWLALGISVLTGAVSNFIAAKYWTFSGRTVHPMGCSTGRDEAKAGENTDPGDPLGDEETDRAENISLSIIIPAHNAQDRIGLCLARLEHYLTDKNAAQNTEIIVAEDGSTDNTVRWAELFAKSSALPVVVNHSDERKGKGGGVLDALRFCRGNYVVVVDTDLPVPMYSTFSALNLLISGADVVWGKRYGRGASRDEPLRRRVLSRGFHLLVRLLLGVGQDSQCGFFAAKVSILRMLMPRLRTSGFSFQAELLLLAKKTHLRVVSLPVEWTYSGGSSVDLKSDVSKMFMELLKIWWHKND